jgi:hypothetical protein
MRTREEHLEWCKQRAREYLDAGDLENAVVSMGSDLSKHPETNVATNGVLMMVAMLYLTDRDATGVRRWVEGFR